MSAMTALENTLDEKSYERNNPPKLLEYAERNRQLGLFNDVTIQSENKSYSANKMVLSCCSRYFEGMFTTNMKEKYQSSVEMESVDADSLGNLIEYIYTGKISLNCENVCNILSAADYLQIDDVKEICFDYLKKAVSYANCFILLAIAKRYKNLLFKNHCVKFVANNFDEIVLNDGFKHCSNEDLIDLISKFHESRVSETLSYRSIVAWTKHDDENRSPGFYDLLKLINFDELSPQFIESEVCEEELLTRNLDCAKVLNQTMKRCLRSHTRENGIRIVSVGGRKTPLKTTEIYNIYNEPVSTFPDLPENRQSGCAVKVRDSVYFIGGTDPGENLVSKIVWSMNLKDETLKWKEEASLNCARTVMGAAALNHNVVVVGGTDGNTGRILSLCEAYSSSLHVWKNIPQLNQSRGGHAVVSCQDCLYALGGRKKRDDCFLSSVERMLLYEKWENVNSMQIARSWFAAVSCNDVVYAMGGQSGIKPDTTQKSVEKYDPAVNEWTFVSEMNFARCAFSACVIQGKIFVVGGINKEEAAVKEIECYDPLDDKWSIVGNHVDELCHHSLIVI